MAVGYPYFVLFVKNGDTLFVSEGDHVTTTHATYQQIISPQEPDTIAYRLYKTLRHDIRRGVLSPGMALKTEWLKENYQVSTSPCREALARLAAQGYVVAEGKKGFRVREVSLQDYKNIMELRTDMECSALKKSINNAEEDWDDRLVVAYHRLAKAMLTKMSDVESIEHREDRHRIFHLELLSGCGSSWLLGYYDQLSDHAERYRHIALKDIEYDQEYVSTVDAEHFELLQLAQQGRADEAVALIRKHRVRTSEQVIRLLKKAR